MLPDQDRAAVAAPVQWQPVPSTTWRGCLAVDLDLVVGRDLARQPCHGILQPAKRIPRIFRWTAILQASPSEAVGPHLLGEAAPAPLRGCRDAFGIVLRWSPRQLAPSVKPRTTILLLATEICVSDGGQALRPPAGLCLLPMIYSGSGLCSQSCSRGAIVICQRTLSCLASSSPRVDSTLQYVRARCFVSRWPRSSVHTVCAARLPLAPRHPRVDGLASWSRDRATIRVVDRHDLVSSAPIFIIPRELPHGCAIFTSRCHGEAPVEACSEPKSRRLQCPKVVALLVYRQRVFSPQARTLNQKVGRGGRSHPPSFTA